MQRRLLLLWQPRQHPRRASQSSRLAPESRLNIRAVQLFALLAVMGSDREINKENTGLTVTGSATHIRGNSPRLIGQLVFGL